MNEAIYVIFDRKYEFVNEKFTELFGVNTGGGLQARIRPDVIGCAGKSPPCQGEIQDGSHGGIHGSAV